VPTVATAIGKETRATYGLGHGRSKAFFDDLATPMPK